METRMTIRVGGSTEEKEYSALRNRRGTQKDMTIGVGGSTGEKEFAALRNLRRHTGTHDYRRRRLTEVGTDVTIEGSLRRRQT
jgi:hypothetical protein